MPPLPDTKRPEADRHSVWSWALWMWVTGAAIGYLLQFPDEAEAVLALLGGA